MDNMLQVIKMYFLRIAQKRYLQNKNNKIIDHCILYKIVNGINNYQNKNKIKRKEV